MEAHKANEQTLIKLYDYGITPKIGKLFIIDEAQLPGVGSEQVLKDLIDAKVIPTIILDTIHRQAEHSSIIHLANVIREGNLPSDLYERYVDRFIIKENEKTFMQSLQGMIDYFISRD